MTWLRGSGFAGLLAVAIAGSASAADMPRPPSYYTPYYAPISVFTWSGFYLGLSGGYTFGSSTWTNATVNQSFDVSGGIISTTAGYNFQAGNFVFGAEGDVGRSWIKGSSTAGGGVCGAGNGCETENTWLGTARGRIGYAMGRWLPFVTGGAAFAGVTVTTAAGGSTTKTLTGWTVGGGVEYAFAGPWTGKIEYLYADLGTLNCDVSICGTATDVTYTANIIRLGVNYRF